MIPNVELYLSRTSDVVMFLRGLSKGLVGEDLGADFGQCLNEGSGVATDIEIAVDLIEQGGLNDIVNGIFKIVNIVKEIPVVYSDCKSISVAAIQKLEAFGARFSDFNALFHKVSMNMLFHGAEIFGDFAQAKTFLDQGNFFNSGLFGGLAISVATQ